MHNLDAIQTPQEMDLLVAFADLAGFHRNAIKMERRTLFDFLDAYYEFVGDTIEGAGGKVIKFIGDAALIVFTDADAGMRALLSLKEDGDAWLQEQGSTCRHYVKVHVGPAIVGPVGTRSDKRFDVYGETVNSCAMLKANCLVITPQAFRSLAPETRKRFKKHTPPLTYIPVEEPHRD